MQTRVGRHSYEEELLDTGGRTKKNADLYSKTYSDSTIKVPNISNGRELDEKEFQRILDQGKTRVMKTIDLEEIEEKDEPILKSEEKVYDINSVLEKAKNRRKNSDNKQYKVPSFEEYIPLEDQEVNSDMDLLSDLMGDDNTIVTPRIDNDTIIENIDDDTMTDTKIDDSFYSKSIKFERKDFLDSSSQKKKHSKVQIGITITIVVLLIVAVVLGIIVLSKIKF